MFTYRKIAYGVAALTLGAITAVPVAAVTNVGSGAYGLYTDVSVLGGVVGLEVGPLAPISGSTTGAAYNPAPVSVLNAGANNQTVLLNVPRLTANVTTGVMTTTAHGGAVVAGVPSSQTSNATALVNNLDFSLKSTLLTTFELKATTISSFANAGGDPTANVNGGATITGLTLKVAGIDLFATAQTFINVGPNTDLLGFVNLDLLGLTSIVKNRVLDQLAGLSIILNEQIVPSTNDASGARITVNAIHVIFNSVPALGTKVLRGDVIVSQSRAFIESANSATPEPAIWAQMITGFGLIGFATRRRRVAAAA